MDTQHAPDILPDESQPLMDQKQVALYYRMKDENLLACETRTLMVPNGRLMEDVIVETLVAGPSPAMLDLSGLFSSGTRVVKVWGGTNMLTVTLSNDFLSAPPDAPAIWENDAMWRNEIFTSRQMALASIVNTITEATDYTSVQFLVLGRNDDMTGRRLLMSELYEGASGEQVLEPMSRSEYFILTHYNTANVLMQSWLEQDFSRLYRFVAQESAARPTDADFQQAMSESGMQLVYYALSAGTVSNDGQTAVLELTYECLSEGRTARIQSYPLRLVREDGIWKITYADLTRLMEAI